MKALEKAQRAAVISAPKPTSGFTLHPVTFGLLEWLQSKRKNPLVIGGEATLRHAAELCFSFTRPAAEIVSIPDAKLRTLVDAFMVNLSPADFKRLQAHAQSELMKFQETAVVPKKPQVRAAPTARKRK